MKKYILSSLAVGSLGALLIFGAGSISPTVTAFEGPEAVGIIVKNGSKMEELLADNFTLTEEVCDPAATTTPQEMCTGVLFENRPVKVYYTAPDSMIDRRGFINKLGVFPFSGRVEYVNRRDEDVEPRLIQFMFERGAGSYTIIREP